MYGDIYNGEYDDPMAPAIFGHPLAAGAQPPSAPYDPFKPYLPEWYTSAGGSMLVEYDSSGNRYAQPQYRSKPQVAGTDRGNTTFFVGRRPARSRHTAELRRHQRRGTARGGDRRPGAAEGGRAAVD